MSERKKFRSVFSVMLAVFLLPFFVICASAFGLPAYFKSTFLGELSEKYDRLRTVDEPKITVVGGSSAAFGLDSEMLERCLGRKAVNFGLYANLGTKLMMDLSRENVREGDIIVLAPELNAETYSLRFNAETAARAIDGSPEMLKRIAPEDRASLVGAIWGLGGKKLGYALTGERPENSGAYRKENFNEFGDNVFDRPYNVMSGYGNAVTLDFAGIPEFEEFIAYVNDYTAYVRSRGAEVYFSFPPINSAAIEPFNSPEEIRDFQAKLSLSLDCRVISGISDYIMDEGYFYDSEFHLNNSGVTVRTAKLIDDLNREAGDLSVTLEELPLPAGRRPDCDDFDLVRLNDARGWAVASVSESASKKSCLSVPDEVGGIPVLTILSGAFKGCAAGTVELGRNITAVEPGAFDGADGLNSMIISDGVSPDISIPGEISFGRADGFAVYLPPESFGEMSAYAGLSEIKELLRPDESFVFEPCEGGVTAVSLTETGRRREILSLPDEAGGENVVAIAGGALSGAQAKKLVLGKNISRLEPGCFDGTAPGLEVRLAEGASPETLELPDSPESLGGSPQIYAFWEDYAALAEKYGRYGGTLTADNIYLKLEKAESGWTVVGVNEEGAALNKITVPDEVDGLPVRTVAGYAFAECEAESLDIGRGVERLDGYAFSGSKITEVIIPDGRGPGDISVPNALSEALATEGCAPGLRISVDGGLYQSYVGDYFWGDYGSRLEARRE